MGGSESCPWRVLVTVAVVAVAAVASAQPACGDCDGDTTIDIVDALVTAQDAVGLILVPPSRRPACDVDASGDLTVLDALGIAVVAAGGPGSLSCPATRELVGLAPRRALGTTQAYDAIVRFAAGGHPLVLVSSGEVEQIVLEARFLLAPYLTDVAAASNPDGSTSYRVTGTAVTVTPGGLVIAGSTSGCALVEATFTPDGIASTGAPLIGRFAACVDLGGPDDDPPGDRSSLADGQIDLTLPGSPSGPALPAAGGAMDVFAEVQAGSAVLGAYQLELEWTPASPWLELDTGFGGAGGGGAADFGVSSLDPASGLPLSPLDFGPQVSSDNVLGRTVFLDLNSTLDASATGVVRVACLRFVALAGSAATATISGSVVGVASTAPVADPSIGAPTPRPLVAGAGSFELP